MNVTKHGQHVATRTLWVSDNNMSLDLKCISEMIPGTVIVCLDHLGLVISSLAEGKNAYITVLETKRKINRMCTYHFNATVTRYVLK